MEKAAGKVEARSRLRHFLKTKRTKRMKSMT
jgi:hypothetical protein